MNKSNYRKHLWCLVAVATTLTAGSASAYTPKWIDCTGQSVTNGLDGKPQGSPAPTHEIFVYDDDSKNLYKFNETTKATSPEPVTSYTPQAVQWAVGEKMGHEDPYWEGRIDLMAMTLKLDYHEKGMTTTTTEMCKATAAVADAK